MHSSLRLDIRLLSYSIVRNPWSSLIPLSRGSFDVIVGMDWLSKRKFVIVCHEKVVRIPLEGDEILQVHGERTQGVVKTLMNTKKGRVKLKRVRAMSMTIQSSVKDKILATPSETPKAENAPAEMLRDMDQQMEKRADDGKANVVADALSRKERVKPRCVRAMAMTIQYGVREMILTAQSEAFKQENVPLVGSEMDEAHASSYTRRFQDVKLARIYIDEIIARNGILHPQADGQSERIIQTLEDIMRACVIDFGGSYQLSIRCAPFKALYGRKCRSPVLWAEIGGSSLIGPELVQETTDKVVLVKEKPKAARYRQKSYVNFRSNPLEFEVGDRVLLRVSPWKGVMCFGKKGKLALRYVGPFKILERIGLIAYRLRLPEELNSVHDTFHVSNLKKCLADASLHVSLDEIKVDKTLCFVEEPVEIMDREIRKLKRRKIAFVKVRWNSKRGPEFTWEHEDQMRIKYPQLFVDRVVEPAS
ncbi:putative reverse transcriptase domain-containing protein [Tanacetum coccineum]